MYFVGWVTGNDPTASAATERRSTIELHPPWLNFFGAPGKNRTYINGLEVRGSIHWATGAYIFRTKNPSHRKGIGQYANAVSDASYQLNHNNYTLLLAKSQNKKAV